jgi:hypothetical protein
MFNKPIFIDLIQKARELRGWPIITRTGGLALHPLLYGVGFNPFFSKEKICLVVGYIVDLTLILCSVFRSPGNVSPGGVQSMIDNFASSSLKTSIHNDISNFIRMVPQFQYHDDDVIIAKIKDLTLRNWDPPRGNAHI